MKMLFVYFAFLSLCNLAISVNYSKCKKSNFPKPPCCGEYEGPADAEAENFIKGGTVTGLNEFPWMAFIISSNKQVGYTCGGSLINSRWILTAAHCIQRHLKLHVRLIEWNLRTDPDCDGNICQPKVLKLKVDRAFVHKRYDKSQIKNDLALIRLKEEISFSKFVHPICLPLMEPKDLDGKIAITTGWGKFKKEKVSAFLRKAPMSIWSKKECADYSDNINTTVHLCAGGVKGVAICDGDSGGPLMTSLPTRLKNGKVYQFLIGTTSLSYGGCGQSGSPGIFLKVSKYIKWIKTIVNKYK